MSRIEFPRSSPESLGIPSAAVESLLDRLEESSECEPHALMVMRHGQVAVEGWWSPYAPRIPHALYSLTKTYTGTAIGLAYTEGLLGLDDRLVDFLPEFASTGEPANNRITIRHALTMTTGKPLVRADNAEWQKHFFEIPFNADPGETYEYSCEDTHALMAVLQKVSGQALHEFLEQRLFDKIGIESNALKWARLLDGSEVGCGGLFATAEDSLRLMKLYLDGGVWDGERLLAADFVKQATTSQVENSGHGYGFQMHIGSAYSACYGSGALGQLAMAVPELDMVVVLYQAGKYRRAGLPGPGETFRSAEYYFDGISAIFQTLLPAVVEGRLEENSPARDRLNARLDQLAAHRPRSLPSPATAEKVSGRKFQVRDGAFTIRSNLWNHITSGEPFDDVTGAEWFSFDFAGSGTCVFRCFEDGEEVSLIVGLDATSRMNRFPLHNLDVDLVTLDATWVSEDELILNVRWIETCYSASLKFQFTANAARVSLEHVDGDYGSHPMRDRPVTGVTV